MTGLLDGDRLPACAELFAELCADSIAMAAGMFDAAGNSLYLNRGMALMLERVGAGRSGVDAFVNPTFLALWNRTRDGGVFSGTLTLGDGSRSLRSLRARSWRRDDCLLVVGEMDVLELDRLNQVLIDANREINGLQRELIKRNRMLQSHVAELDRQKRLHQGFTEIHHAILRQTEEGPLLDDLCEVAVHYGELALAWVGFPDGKGGIISRAAAGSIDYLSGLKISLDAHAIEGQGPTAAAFRTGIRQIVNDVQASRAMGPWHERARRHGLAASAAFPLCTARGVIGVLSVYADRVDFFGADQIRLLDRLATDLAFAIEASRQARALYESETRYRLIFDHAPLGLVHYGLDGTVIDCNPSYVEIVGSSRSRIIGCNLLRDLKDARVIEAVGRSLTTGSAYLNIVYRSVTVEKTTPVRCFFSGIRDAAGAVVAGVGIVEDFSERKAIEARLSASEERLKLAVDVAGIGVWDVAVASKAVLWDAGMSRLHGSDAEPRMTDLATWIALIDPEDRALFERTLAQAVQGLAPLLCDLRICRPDGEERHLRMRGRLFRGDLESSARVIGISYDVTDQRRADARIQALAFYDPLTGLANRRLLMERITQAQARSHRRGDHGALLLLDIDHFKRLNDTRGHDIGDALLVEIAKRLTAGLRETDTAARLGGDELVVLCEALNLKAESAAHEACLIAEKIGSLIRAPCRLGPDRLDFLCTASIGITLFRGHETTPSELLKQADIAMYQAKRAGRETMRLFQPGMQQAIEEMAQRENALRRAVAQGDLRLDYQPQVDRDGRWVGCEALLRWSRHDGTTLMPPQFLPDAETIDIMPAIRDWVVQTACRDIANLPATARTGPDLVLGINVSARQLADPRLIERIIGITEPLGFPPDRLRLEISEACLFSAFERNAQILVRLHAAGIGIELDDFGSGYSSLVHLRELPLTGVKIDQRLVGAIDREPDMVAIVRAAIAVADALSLPVIAEGVERASQHALLLELGCVRFQGYLFGRPMSLDAFRAAFVQTHES